MASRRDDAREAFEPPRSIAPTPRLSGRGLVLVLACVCAMPLVVLSVYAAVFGRAVEQPLSVDITLDRRLLPTIDGKAKVLEDVVVIENRNSFEVPKVTLNLNGQYFLYQDQPLGPGEILVLRQAAFATKSSQRFVPGRYPITKVIVTGQLPSGARGVKEVTYPGRGLDP